MYKILLRGAQGESGTRHFSASFPQQKLRGGFAGEGSRRWAKQGLLLLCSTGSASQGAAAVPCLPSQPPPAARRCAWCRSLRGYAPVRSWLFSPSFSSFYCLPLLFCFISSHSQKISRQTLPPKTMWSSMCYCFGWVHAFHIHFKGGMSIKPYQFYRSRFSIIPETRYCLWVICV